MKLYSLARVEAVESLDAFKVFHASVAARRGPRKAASQKAVRTRANKTIAAIDAIDLPPFEVLERAELLRLARLNVARVRTTREASMTERQMHRGELDGDNHEYEPLSAEDPQAREEAFLVRIAVNYLRHECSKYDGYCASLKSKIGRDEAYLRLRERVHQLIKMAYPWLSDECDQQLEAAKDRVATAHY